MQNFQGSLMEYLKSSNGITMPAVDTRQRGGHFIMEAPIANWADTLPPLENYINFPSSHQVQNQGVESNWKVEPAIEFLRAGVKNKIKKLFMEQPDARKMEKTKRDIIVTNLEEIRFEEAASKKEYWNINDNSLRRWITKRVGSLLQDSNDKQEVAARSNMQITDEATRSFHSLLPNYCSRPVGLSNYQQQDRNQLYQQQSTQGMLFHSSPNYRQLVAGGTSGCYIQENPDQQFRQTQSVLTQFNRNGELATNGGSAAYYHEAEITSWGGTMNNDFDPTDYYTYQQQDQQIQQCNGAAYLEELKRYSPCQAFIPERGTRSRTCYDDENVNRHKGETLQDIVFPFCKRPRIVDPCSAPLSVRYETSQERAPIIDLPLSLHGLPQMHHQQPLVDNRPNPLLYGGYGTPEEREAPFSLPLSFLHGLPQQMHQGSYSSEVITEETLEHWKIDDPRVPVFPDFETSLSWAPTTTLSSQGLPAPDEYEHPYVPLSDGSNVNHEELIIDSSSAADEDIVQNIFNLQVKTEEVEHIPAAVDHHVAAGSMSETWNQNISHSVVELLTPEKIKEPVMNCSIQDSSEAKLGQQKPYGADIVTSEEEELMTSSSNQQELSIVQAAEPDVVVEPQKPDKSKKIKGASLTELFTPEQIKEHLKSLGQWFGESKANAEKKRATADCMNENACSMCGVMDHYFEAPNCSLCRAHFKKKDKYYTASEGDANYFFCTVCYNETKEEKITVGGLHINKARLEKSKNIDKIMEPWVECDKCKSWQHQICALFNSKRNVEDKAEYKCPKCYVQEIEIGQCMPLPQSAILGAKDLKRTKLSDFIEERLFSSLKQLERKYRAKKTMGKNFNDEVLPGVEDIVVRVVLSADKTLQVKQNFLGVFKDENYPKQFPYRSKVILLFQKIEGVEVCLFGMYVQEFGSECARPNHRSIYISYLDSVKFLRPDIKLASGETLRTFVYHEILVGYLDYCKKRGFNRCYIWSCPPPKAHDYIFYCHPEIQKTFKSEHLRQWYHAMLRKATSENIIMNVTNLYEDFFVTHDECNKVTATHLPYFDGDYWPRVAEDMLKNLVEEEDGVLKPRRKQKKKKPKSRRSLETIECTGSSSGTSKTDIQLMQQLGKTIFKTKENFIVVSLESEHSMPLDTEDNDEIIEAKIFESRETFLHFCETNNYQFDTLRRAKYSTMMLLYHLHNPSE